MLPPKILAASGFARRISCRDDAGVQICNALEKMFIFSKASHPDKSRSALAERFERHLSLVFEHSPSILYFASIDQGYRENFTEISAAVDQVLGVTREKALEVGWWNENIHPQDFLEAKMSFSNLSAGRIVQHEYRIRSGSGRFLWFSDTFYVVSDPDDENQYGLGFLYNIHDHKELNSQSLLLGRLANLGELAASMAHELMQPLNTIKIAAFNLKTKIEMGIIDPISHEARLDRIIRQTDRAANLISHLRIFGRKSSQKKTLFSLADALRGALGLVEHQFSSLGIRTSLEIPSTLPFLNGHQILLEQVFVNLFLNVRDAVHYSPRINETHIIIEAMENEGWIEIHFSDNAGGIQEDILPDIFKPFVTTKAVSEGAGLGLSISKGIIQDMGGTIEVKNIEEGACFTLKFPNGEIDNGRSF